MRYLFLITCSFSLLFVMASENKLDSLKSSLNKVTGKNRVTLLVKYAEQLKYNNLTEAIYYGKQAINEADELGMKQELMSAYLNTGMCYYFLGNYDKAVAYYYKTEKVARELNDTSYMATVENELGVVYADAQNYKKALASFNKALAYHKTHDDKRKIASLQINIGALFKLSGEYDSAAIYLEAALKYFKNEVKDDYGLAICLNSLGELQIELGNYNQADTLLQKSLTIAKNMNSNELIGGIYQRLGVNEMKKGNYTKALDFINQELALAYRINNRSWLSDGFRYQSEIYELMGMGNLALKSYKTHVLYNDSLLNREQLQHISDLEVQHEVEIREQKISLLKQEAIAQRYRQYFIVTGFLFLLSAITIIFIVLRKKLIQIKTERKLLKNKLLNSNKELTNLALHIIEESKLLDEVKSNLKQLRKTTKPEDRIQLENNITLKLNNRLGIEQDKQLFNEKINQIGGNFLLRLTEQYPSLTENDKRLAALLRLNVSSKEIASLLNIESSSVYMNRHRLRKKLNLSIDANVESFLNSI